MKFELNEFHRNTSDEELIDDLKRVAQLIENHGIGSVLMDVAENIASQYADTVYLGVGLHSGYGSAQRMYAKRGYIPDGSGAWYGEKVCDQYAKYCNDEDFVLYLEKKLR